MTRDELLATMRAERARWEALLAAVGDERMTEPGAEDAWSVRDILAHITRYERWLADQLAAALGQPPAAPATGAAAQRETVQADRPTPVAWRDRHRRQVGRARAPRALRAEAAHEFARLLELVAALPDEMLAERGRFQWTAGQPLWRAIAGESYEHYAQHAGSIRVWLAGRAA